MSKDELRLKIKKAKVLTEFSLIFWFLFWSGAAYFSIDYLDGRLEGNQRLLFLPIFIVWLIGWMGLFLFSSRIINKKSGLICPHCDMVCYGSQKSEHNANRDSFVSTGKCNRCQEVIFEISDG